MCFWQKAPIVNGMIYQNWSIVWVAYWRWRWTTKSDIRCSNLGDYKTKKDLGGWYKICRIALRPEGAEWCVSYSFVAALKKQKKEDNLLVWSINVPGLKQSNPGSNHFDLMNKLTCSICIISSLQKRTFFNSDMHIYTCKQDTYLRIRLDQDKRRFSFTYSVPYSVSSGRHWSLRYCFYLSLNSFHSMFMLWFIEDSRSLSQACPF